MKRMIKILTLCCAFVLFCLMMTACGHEHAYGEWVTVKAPTCTETGMQERTCECGQKESGAISATGHTLGDWVVTKEPTVKEDGAKEKKCNVCEEIRATETIPATGSLGLAYTVYEDIKVCVVTGIGVCTDTELVIPSAYNGMPVTGIGEKAFKGCSSLTSVWIPEGVTSISKDVFYNCENLMGVTVAQENPNYCSVDGVLFNKTITELIYYPERKNETSYVMPNNVTSIGNSAFHGCSSLISIVLSDSVTSIGEDAFRDCSGLMGITIPNSVTSIGESAFDGCSSLTSMTLPFVGNTLNGTTNTHFGYIFGAFSDYQGSYIPTSLKTVVITGGLSIGDRAFAYCSGLTSITIGNSVTSIGDYAFGGCSSLLSITIGENVTSIGYGAFYDCSGLTEVYYQGKLDQWMRIGFTSSPCVNGSALYINGELLTELVISDSVTSINSYAFSGCTSLTSIMIPNGVTSIGHGAFYGCSGLTSIMVDSNNPNYASIDGVLFDKAITELICYPERKNETSYVMPNNVTSIGNGAFDDCSSLISIVLSDSVTGIGVDAFCGCSGLTGITIPNSVTSIGEFAFYGCSSLTIIEYTGTTAEWKAISKGSDWKYGVPATKVVCSDGEVYI